jgi:hypothetical protein
VQQGLSVVGREEERSSGVGRSLSSNPHPANQPGTHGDRTAVVVCKTQSSQPASQAPTHPPCRARPWSAGWHAQRRPDGPPPCCLQGRPPASQVSSRWTEMRALSR